ncbi:MAG: hypothetical protein KBE22_11715, partial [Candidatus Accumulibacter sp.]|nr:hypothetical protein [Accumulibacter sp.]
SSDATVSLNNTVHHNILDAAVGVRVSAGSGHKVHQNTLKTNSVTSATVSSYVVETCTGADISNNLCIAGDTSYLGTIRAGTTNLTGKNNCYVFDGRAANAGLFFVNATPIGGATTGVNAVSWQQARAAYDAAIVSNSYGVAGFDAGAILNDMADTLYINSEYTPQKGHAAIGMGYPLGYTKDIYGQGVEFTRPTVGAVSF